jgi:hypothetical protein
MVAFLSELPPAQTLRVVQDRELQVSLGLVDRTLYGLSTIQVLVATFVGLCAVLTAGLCLLLPHASAGGGDQAALSKAMYAVFSALLLFGGFSFLFQHQRDQIDRLIGEQATLMPAFFTALAICATLLLLSVAFSKTDGRIDLTALVVRLVPVLGFGLMTLKEDQFAPYVRKLVGVETNAATQAMWGVFLALVTTGVVLWMLVGGLEPIAVANPGTQRGGGDTRS